MRRRYDASVSFFNTPQFPVLCVFGIFKTMSGAVFLRLVFEARGT